MSKLLNVPVAQSTAYGVESTILLAHFYNHIDTQQLAQAIHYFYDHFAQLPAAQSVLGILTESECEHLRAEQTSYLKNILSPDLDAAQHHQLATAAGIRYFNMGLSTELLVESAILYDDVTAILTTNQDNPQALAQVITRRFQYDLSIKIGAYSSAQQERNQCFQRIVEHGHAARDAQDFLLFATHQLRGLSEVSGIAIGVVDKSGYRHVASSGNVLHSQLDPTQCCATSTIATTWHDERPLIIPYLTEQSPLSVDERAACMSMNIHALGIWLGRGTHGAVGLSLMVCSSIPGFLLSKDSQFYWQSMITQITLSFELLVRGIVVPKYDVTEGEHLRQLLQQGKVVILYQPIINPATGKAVKVEALARLIDGDHLISPAIFLPRFSSSQLRDLFDICVAHVLKDMHAPSMNHLMFTINLPPEAMSDLAWLASLPARLAAWKIDTCRIGFEIIESSITDNDAVINALHKLRAAGYAIWLDDVGTGQSSLLRLATLPVSGIKIDQSFIRELTHNFERLDLIVALMLIAEQRGLECVAEGVETDEIADVLGSVGGMLLQGYYFAKPMPVDMLRTWMTSPENQQSLHFPSTLSGWYSLHLAQLYSVRKTISIMPDLLDVQALSNAEQCPLHHIIEQIGGDDEIKQAHSDWHNEYTNFVRIAKEPAHDHILWQAIETSKEKLRGSFRKKYTPPLINYP